MTLSDLTDSPLHRGMYLGIEVELENVTQDLPLDDEERPMYDTLSNSLIKCVPDGSLRNHGAEFIFSKPLMFGSREFNQAIQSIQDVGTRVQATTSQRTSTHYHLNVSDCNVQQFQNVLYLSLLIEPVLMKYCSENRQNNRFCVPSYQTLTQHYRRAVKSFKTKNTYAFHDNTVHCTKYAAISLHRAMDLGTIEYRMFDGTYNKDELQAVSQVLTLIKRIAMRKTLSEIQESKVQGRLINALTRMIRRAFGSKVSDSDIKALLDKGSCQANDLCTKSSDVYNLLGELNDFCNKLEQREVSESPEREIKPPEGENPATTVSAPTPTTGAFSSERRPLTWSTVYDAVVNESSSRTSQEQASGITDFIRERSRGARLHNIHYRGFDVDTITSDTEGSPEESTERL